MTTPDAFVAEVSVTQLAAWFAEVAARDSEVKVYITIDKGYGGQSDAHILVSGIRGPFAGLELRPVG